MAFYLATLGSSLLVAALEEGEVTWSTWLQSLSNNNKWWCSWTASSGFQWSKRFDGGGISRGHNGTFVFTGNLETGNFIYENYIYQIHDPDLISELSVKT